MPELRVVVPMTGIEAKIAKLLRLASHNPNEAEATAAAEKAQDLMLKHGIEMGQISLDDGQRVRTDKQTIPSKLDEWRTNLGAAIARSAGGELVYQRDYGKWKGNMHFVGPYGTVQSMVDLYLYLEGQLDRISLVEAALVHHVNAAQSMRWRRSYLYGMSMRVCQRLDARVVKAASSSNALVPVKDAVQQRIDEDFGKVKQVGGNASVDDDAVMQGYLDGNRVPLGDDELNDRTVQELLN